MKTPPIISICPVCGNNSEMSMNLETITYRNTKEYTYWVYTCTNCAETFTTSESDEISLSYNKKRRLKEKRRKKLNRLLNENI